MSASIIALFWQSRATAACRAFGILRVVGFLGKHVIVRSRSNPFALIAGAFLVLSALLVLAWTLRPPGSLEPCVVAADPVRVKDIPESSGLAVSRRAPGLLWSHNDSGHDAVLFAVDRSGLVRGQVRVPVRTRDWEDVSVGPCGSHDCVYIADIGDNRAERREIRIYRVPEPAAEDTDTATPDVFNVTYADRPHNAEAMFVIASDLFIVSKDRSSDLYRAASPASGGAELVFQRIGRLGLEAVTDAETSTDGRSVVVRTSHEALLYRSDDMHRGGNVEPYLRIQIASLHEAQGEGVALDGNMLYLSSEGGRGGSIVALRCELPH
jgi:hypothetical protein